MRKRVLITGAAGFIGYHLALALKGRGDDVVGYDNFNSYYSPRLKRERARRLASCGIAVEEGDICEGRRLKEIAARQGTTHIVHLAAQAGVRYSLENPQAYVKSNLAGFVEVLELCRERPDTRLIYASSSSVYGNSPLVPFSEENSVDRQASLYGVTKRSNELLAATYHELFGFPVTGLRYFTVYGPWGRPDMAYFTFTEKMLKGEPLPLFNGGQLARDFTYIDDIVEGTVAAVDLGASSALFNLGREEPVSLERFVALLEKAIGKRAATQPLAMQQGDVKATCADLSHSRDLLGYCPKVSLEEGLERFVSWYRENVARNGGALL